MALAGDGEHVAQATLNAGALLVVVEKSDVALVIRNQSDTLHRLMRGVGPDKLIIECGPGADRFEIAKWLLREFGPEVNLFVDHSQILMLETFRAGIWGFKDFWGRIQTYKG